MFKICKNNCFEKIMFASEPPHVCMCSQAAPALFKILHTFCCYSVAFMEMSDIKGAILR